MRVTRMQKNGGLLPDEGHHFARTWQAVLKCKQISQNGLSNRQYNRTHANYGYLTLFLPRFERLTNKLRGASTESICIDNILILRDESSAKTVPVMTQASLDWQVSDRLFRICSWSAGLASNPVLPPITLMITLKNIMSRALKKTQDSESRSIRKPCCFINSRAFTCEHALVTDNCFRLVWISCSSIHRRHPSVYRSDRRHRSRGSTTAEKSRKMLIDKNS